MKTLRLAIVLALTSTASLVGCSIEGTDGATPGSDPARGVGKADGVFGSCGDEDACGGPAAEGNCWCDVKCADYGDCCADKVDVCGGDDPIDPEPQLCLSDNECGDGMHCDHSECLSGCTGGDGIVCPAVCFGACEEGEPECDVNPLTVFCQPDTFFSVEECACIPIDEDCSSKDKEECNASDDCEWETFDGFPGPISMCVEKQECDINPATVFCQPDTVFSVEACACIPIEEPEECELPDDSYEAVDGDTLMQDVSAFEGERVLLTGTSAPTPPICTQLACFPEAPCCNSCGAGIEMVLGGGALDMSGIGCGGNNCEVLANCEYGFGEDFIAWGVIEESFGTHRLIIDGHCGA